jgi:diacylglycerol kinase family enzyme
VHIVVVTNPVARRTRPHLTRFVADSLSEVAKVRVAQTTHRNHATELAAQAAAEGADLVVALGGDGTVNEVLQGVALTDTALAVLPGGSTNVYARILDLPRSLVGATAALRAAIEADRRRIVPAGRADDRWFAWCAGFGYDAEVVHEVEVHPRMKRWLGQPSFLVHGVGVRRRLRAERIRVQAGQDEPAVEVGGGVVICKADPYTFLGPLPSRMCPDAVLDGGLDCTAMTDLRLSSLLRVMRRALTGRDVLGLGSVTAWHDRASFDLHAERPLAVHTDGDPVGTAHHLHVRVVPEAVTLVV